MHEIISSVNILMAIRWVALAWREVKEITITKCFKNAGVLNDNSDVVEVTSENPFQDVDERMSLSSLISTAMGSLDSCSVEEYVQGTLKYVQTSTASTGRIILWTH